MEHDIGNIGQSMIIKGELRAKEDLTIEGHVDGKVELDHNVLDRRQPPRLHHCASRVELDHGPAALQASLAYVRVGMVPAGMYCTGRTARTFASGRNHLCRCTRCK